MNASDEMGKRSWVPWDRPGEWVIWLVALLIATIFIHNFTQIVGDRVLRDDAGAVTIKAVVKAAAGVAAIAVFTYLVLPR